jgi:peptide/nickel transport system substrate-binding protein
MRDASRRTWRVDLRAVALGIALAGPWVLPPPARPAPDRLVVATSSEAITVNPFDASVTTPDSQIILNMYDALVVFDPDGTLRPGLATSWEPVSPTVTRFRLRRGVRFHNGEELTAEDVRFTLESILDPSRKHKLRGNLASIERVETPDPWTVNVVLHRPDALAVRHLHRVGIVSARYVRANPGLLDRHPNGTGSYRFVEWARDDHLTMEAFEGGWRGRPAITRVVWRPIKEASARVAALVAGEVDVAHGVPFELTSLIARSPGAEVRQVPSMRAYWLMMVNTRPELPTSSREVRQAINHALDRNELNRAFFGGAALPLATMVHPRSLGHDPSLGWSHDPARARALLAQAGFAGGLTLGMHASDGRYPRDRELSHAIAGQLAKVGITVRVRNLEVGQFVDGIHRKTTDPLVLLTYGNPYRDATGSLPASHGTGRLWSVLSYPWLDERIRQAEATLDDGARTRVLRDIQAWTMANAPAAYLLTMVEIVGVNRALRWSPRPDDGLFWREAAFTR